MKFFIITQEENLFLPLSLEKVVKVYKDEIVGVLVLKGIKRDFKKLIYEYGFLNSFKIALKIYSNKLKGKTIKNFFRLNNIKNYNYQDINSKRFINLLRELKVDLVISIACPQIFRKELIEVPKKGCINVHGSLLPKYRGRDIAFWVLYNKEKETGATVHYISEKIDQGGIILQKKIKVDSKQETVHSLYKKTVTLSGKSLVEAIELIKKNNVKPQKQKNILKYKQYSEPSLDKIRKFKLNNGKFI